MSKTIDIVVRSFDSVLSGMQDAKYGAITLVNGNPQSPRHSLLIFYQPNVGSFVNPVPYEFYNFPASGPIEFGLDPSTGEIKCTRADEGAFPLLAIPRTSFWDMPADQEVPEYEVIVSPKLTRAREECLAKITEFKKSAGFLNNQLDMDVAFVPYDLNRDAARNSLLRNYILHQLEIPLAGVEAKGK